MNFKEKNKRLIRLAGFRACPQLDGIWFNPTGTQQIKEEDLPNFYNPLTNLLDLHRFIVPKLPGKGITTISIVLPEAGDNTIDVHLLRLDDDILTSPYHGQSDTYGVALTNAVMKLLTIIGD